MRTLSRRRTTTVLILSWILAGLQSLTGASPPDLLRFENEIRTFERLDRESPPEEGQVLFVGSSSIRLWKTLTQDFSFVETINRGFGGSTIAEVTYYADRIVFPYKPCLILLYAGDNDVAGGKTAKQVLADYQQFVSKIRSKLPGIRMGYIAIKPSPSRRHLLDEMMKANQLIRDFSKQEPGLDYLDIATPMLQPDGTPRPELFVDDRLHLNPDGYALWTQVLTPYLKKYGH
ncbi:MAG: SGNH/GDSL hydrolase family protein [Acidobacteriota bacterium]